MKYAEKGHERITVSNSAVALTVPDGAHFALMRVKGSGGDGLCFRADETDPTNATGMELEVGEVLWFDAGLAEFRAIRRDAADVTLLVAYYAA